MKNTYTIEGMTCSACVQKVKTGLERLEQVKQADVQLSYPQATLELTEAVDVAQLQQAIGNYRIRAVTPKPPVQPVDLPEKSLSTYRPLLLIIGFILGISVLAQYPFTTFDWMTWMRHFMAGFFLTFSFFKLLNLEGFAGSYVMYDEVARRWIGWAKIYPFVELGLGILYLTNAAPLFTNLTTFIVLGVSSIGVIRSVLDKRKIKCACLGDVFNLPMSTVTIVEDVTMTAMAGVMLWVML